MRLVRFLVPVAGLDRNHTPGLVYELDDADADNWADGIRGEYADDYTGQTEGSGVTALDALPSWAREALLGVGDPDDDDEDGLPDIPAVDPKPTRRRRRKDIDEPTPDAPADDLVPNASTLAAHVATLVDAQVAAAAEAAAVAAAATAVS